MNSFNNFLWKTFGATLVFFYCMNANDVFAVTIQNAAEDPKIQSYFASGQDALNRSELVTICPSGYYLARCGSKTIGIQWLKGMKKLDTRTVEDKSEKVLVKTADYYSYDTGTNNTGSANMNNLRKFFAGQEDIVYTQKNSSTTKTVSTEIYKAYRNQILSNYCTSGTGELANFECERCPNNAMVSKSTVRQDTEDPEYLIWDTWNVRTIADCYLQEFKDDTGSYVYVATSVEQNKDNGLNCYYNQVIDGSSLYY